MHFGGVLGLIFGVVVDPAWLDQLTFGQLCDKVAGLAPALAA